MTPYVPTGQAVSTPATQYDPTGQGVPVALVEPAAQRYPSKHCRHDEAFPEVKVPAGH